MAGIDLVGVALDAQDPHRVARYWADLLGWELEPRGDTVAVVPETGAGLPLIVEPSTTLKLGQNLIHLDLTTTSEQDLHRLISRARELGGTPADVGQAADEPHTVLADSEGNEFCVIPPGNRFLADTGAVGAINCDGTQALGYFWSAALEWPLVWDQDEETAIQSPAGGSKITWSGPPLMPRHGRSRLRFVLATSDELAPAVARLTALGARVTEAPTSSRAVLRDPDDNDFVLAGGS